MIGIDEIETLPRAGLESIQLQRLQALVARVYERVLPYREKMDQAGIKPEDIRSLKSLILFGVRGMGTVYYLAHAATEENFAAAGEVWAVAVLVVVLSILLHGVAASPVLRRLDRSREDGVSSVEQRGPASAGPGSPAAGTAHAG